MIVLSPQLSDWGQTSADEAIALTEYFLSHYNIAPDRVYLHGMSGGGETGSLVMGTKPEMFTAYLATSSQWDGDLHVLAQKGLSACMLIAVATLAEVFGGLHIQQKQAVNLLIGQTLLFVELVQRMVGFNEGI